MGSQYASNKRPPASDTLHADTHQQPEKLLYAASITYHTPQHKASLTSIPPPPPAVSAVAPAHCVFRPVMREAGTDIQNLPDAPFDPAEVQLKPAEVPSAFHPALSNVVPAACVVGPAVCIVPTGLFDVSMELLLLPAAPSAVAGPLFIRPDGPSAVPQAPSAAGQLLSAVPPAVSIVAPAVSTVAPAV